MGDGKLYLHIYVYGLIFLFMYNVVNGIFQALGDSKTPLYLLIGSSIGNIVLDTVFVMNFHMGVAGVGWATFIAQGVAAVVAFILLMRYIHKMQIHDKNQLFSMRMFEKISVIAVPSICQQSFVSVGNLFIQSVINGYGSSVIAGYNVGLKISLFIITCSISFGTGLSSYAAQNLGAGKIDRVFDGYKATVKMIYTFIAPCILISVFGADFLVHLFIGSSDTKAVSTAVLYLHIVSPFYLILVIKFVCDNILKAAGDMKAFMVTTFSDLIIRVVLAYILPIFFGSTGIWCAWPLGWIIGSGFSYFFYKKKGWMKGWGYAPEKLTQVS